MIIIGAYINSWYNGLVTGDAWFKIQCPLIMYTPLTADVSPVKRFDGSATTTSVADNGWNQATCLDASPIYQWSWEYSWMIVWYSLGFGLWLLNTALGNNGS